MKQNNTTKKTRNLPVFLTAACNRRKLYQCTGCRKQMRSGTAYGQHSCRRDTWSCMGRWHCILCKFTPQSARSRKLYGFSGKHGRCFMLWSGLQKMHILSLTCLAEAIGTGFLGALAAYPVALYLMGIAPAGLFVYVVPFLISTVAGSILAFILITVLEKGGVMSQIREA